jgi:vanillate O-demethylase monooxygenase subunit
MQKPLSQPKDSDFSTANWHVLTRFWHPVAFTTEIADKPYPFVLLGLRLIAYRTTAGFTVALDRCPHRGTSFALGFLKDDRLVCGYHGLQYDGTGRCVAVPSSGPDAKVPPSLCLRVFRSEARYGLLWVLLAEEPMLPLPAWTPLEDPGLQKVKMTPADWACSAARHVENFNDVAHFSWIHAGTFGNRDDPLTPRYQLRNTDAGIYREIKVKQIDRDTFSDKPETVAEMDYAYDFVVPFASYLRIASADGRVEHIFDVVRPISACRSRVFILKARNYDLGQPVDEWIRFQEAVNAEDQAMVESQEPQDLPLDLTSESHIAADAWSIVYRRRWKSLGLE